LVVVDRAVVVVVVAALTGVSAALTGVFAVLGLGLVMVVVVGDDDARVSTVVTVVRTDLR
jgi:hypothetical protein